MLRRTYSNEDEEKRSIALSFRIRPTLHETLEQYSRKQGRTKTYIIEKALIHYFKSNKNRG